MPSKRSREKTLPKSNPSKSRMWKRAKTAVDPLSVGPNKSVREVVDQVKAMASKAGVTVPEFADAMNNLTVAYFGKTADPTLQVSHPAHYGGDVPHEVIKCLEAWDLETDALLWNAVKYIARSAKKGNQLVDLKKAVFYINQRIAKIEACAPKGQWLVQTIPASAASKPKIK